MDSSSENVIIMWCFKGKYACVSVQRKTGKNFLPGQFFCGEEGRVSQAWRQGGDVAARCEKAGRAVIPCRHAGESIIRSGALKTEEPLPLHRRRDCGRYARWCRGAGAGVRHKVTSEAAGYRSGGWRAGAPPRFRVPEYGIPQAAGVPQHFLFTTRDLGVIRA